MKDSFRQLFGWHAGPLDWGPAFIAGLGCALPLLLGLLSAAVLRNREWALPSTS